jgi:hypothetical protein
MSQRLSIAALLGTVILTGACGSDHGAAGMGGIERDPDDAAGKGGAAGGPLGTAGTGGAAGSPGDAAATDDAAPLFFDICRGEGGGTDGAVADGTDAAQATPTCVGAEARCILPIDEHSFVQTTFAISDGTSTAKVTYKPGTPSSFCLSGRLSPSSYTQGFASLLIGLGADPVSSFDISAYRVSKFRFRIVQDRPVTGVHATMVTSSAPCPQDPCVWFFDLPGNVICPGTITVAPSDFNPRNEGSPFDPSGPFDPTRFAGLLFEIDTLPGLAFNYSFCIEALAFLDADGHELTP